MSDKAARDSDREARRLQVWKLLKQVNDEKAVRVSGASLRDRAERTYRIATTPPAVVGPVRYVAAYRLAHLLLRVTEPDLDRVSSLFDEASAFPPLSTLAQIYRVAVLERLLKMEPDEIRRDELARVQKNAFDGARGRLGGGEVFDVVTDSAGALGDRLQGGVFNLLELSAYFTGLPYDDLEGRGSRLDYALERGDWVVIGPEPETRHVHLSEATAKQELEDRAGQSTGGEVFFRLGPTDSEWKVTDAPQYRHCHRQQLKMLALLCADQAIENVPALQERLLTRQQSPDDFRQYKLRLKRGLEQLLGRTVGDLYEDLGGGEGLRLSSDLVVYGAVHVEHIL